MSKVLLDTNVLIYSIDKDSKYFDRSQKVIKNQDLNLFTTIKNISEMLTVITRDKQNNLTIGDALNVVQDVENISTFLYPNYNSYQTFKKLIEKYEPTGLKMHDIEIISISIENNINNIATFDRKDYKNIEEIDLYPL